LAQLFEEALVVAGRFFGLSRFLGKVSLAGDLGILQRVRPGAQFV